MNGILHQYFVSEASARTVSEGLLFIIKVVRRFFIVELWMSSGKNADGC